MRTKFLHKAFLAVGLAVLMCGFAMPASATTFSFSESAGFLVGGTNLVSNDASTPYNDIKWYQASASVAPPTGEYNTIVWGASNNAGALISTFNPWGNSNYSGLQVLGQTGSVATDNWVTITDLYHQNNSISSDYYTLTNATISSVLYITPGTLSGGDANSIPITFTETLNQTPCGAGSPTGTACPDYFGFNAYGTGGSDNGFQPLTFTNGGTEYDVYFRLLAGSGVLRIDFNDVTGDYTIWTNEGATSTMNVQMMISASAVPEPATLALLGLGLLGLGLARRRRKNG